MQRLKLAILLFLLPMCSLAQQKDSVSSFYKHSLSFNIAHSAPFGSLLKPSFDLDYTYSHQIYRGVGVLLSSGISNLNLIADTYDIYDFNDVGNIRPFIIKINQTTFNFKTGFTISVLNRDNFSLHFQSSYNMRINLFAIRKYNSPKKFIAPNGLGYFDKSDEVKKEFYYFLSKNNTYSYIRPYLFSIEEKLVFNRKTYAFYFGVEYFLKNIENNIRNIISNIVFDESRRMYNIYLIKIGVIWRIK